jgi:hypothetical protein
MQRDFGWSISDRVSLRLHKNLSKLVSQKHAWSAQAEAHKIYQMLTQYYIKGTLSMNI